ncbi:MAG: transporter substrate-binding domain-containing protein [Syntrophomonadaceae bacterium]|nr:transporter substrate-binding domain-containing protein [Syntrophomonadaceae bacterium]
MIGGIIIKIKLTSVIRPFVIIAVIIICCLTSSSLPASEERVIDPLTPEDRKWLAAHPVIRLAPDPSFPPIEFFDENGNYSGIAADYFSLIEEKLGIKLQIVNYHSFNELLNAAKNREVDILGSLIKTPERQDYLLFGRSFLNPPVVIITRKNVEGELNLVQLAGRKVVVVSGYAWQGYIKENYPDIDLITVPDPATGLKIVSFGSAFAMVNDLATASYYTEQKDISNLHISGNIEYDSSLYFASRKDWPELNSILNKGLDLITPEEARAINNRWIGMQNDTGLFNQETWNYIKTGIVFILLALIFSLLWNRSLQNQINKNTAQLDEELAERIQSEEDIRQKKATLRATYQELQSSYEEVEALAGELEESHYKLLVTNAELSLTQDRLELALLGAKAGLWDWQLISGELFLNQHYAKHIGYRSNTFIFDINKMKKHIHLEDWPQFEKTYYSFIKDTIPFCEVEYRIKDSSGEWVWIYIFGKIIERSENGQNLRAAGIVQEINNRKQESEKRARYEAEALKMTTLSIMSAGVVHEISQPLNAIKILADGMFYWQESGQTIDIKEAATAFKNISIQAERINDIIIHMRNLSSTVEDGNHHPCNINSAITGTMKILGQQLNDHGISVNLNTDPNLSMAMAHEQRLEEVVINLITNAMRALDELKQSEKLILCSTYQQEQYVVLEVADNGSGISPEIGQQIWEPFFSTKKGGEGMGLGLFIVHSIITRWRGKVSYYNNEWGGATFRVELPCLKES